MKFITELFNRFSLASPKFFQVIQWLSIATAAIAGIPALLVKFQTDLGFPIPEFIAAISSKVVAWAAIIAWVIANLPVKNLEAPKVSAQLPFTEKG